MINTLIALASAAKAGSARTNRIRASVEITLRIVVPFVVLLGLHVIGARGRRAAAAGPVGVEELAARLVGPLVGVGAEVVALGLQEIRGQAAGAVAVEVGQGRAHRRRRE